MKVGGRKENPLDTCEKCGRKLTNIIEVYKGSDHIYLDEERKKFSVDIPQGRTEEPSRYFCNHCGTPLTKKQIKWLEERKD